MGAILLCDSCGTTGGATPAPTGAMARMAAYRGTIRRVVVPLMAGGILAGFVTSFITAAVELSATLLLTSAESQAPMSYGIYLYMQSVAGRGPGAALGVLAIIVVALGTYLSHRVVERTGQRLAPRAVDETLPALPSAAKA